MIGFLSGLVRRRAQKELVLLVGGVGYRVQVSERVAGGAMEGTTIELHIHHAVREDAQTLYGFESLSELELFETLLLVSGIGPKSAMSIVTGTDPAAMRHAIALGDTAYLTKISGIGKKSAEKIVLELQERFKDLPTTESTYASKNEREALEALESLGYSIREIRDVVHAAARDHVDAKEIIAASLRAIGKHA